MLKSQKKHDGLRCLRAVVNIPGIKQSSKRYKITRFKERVIFGIIGISLGAHFG
jgi:hypothetical protein